MLIVLYCIIVFVVCRNEKKTEIDVIISCTRLTDPNNKSEKQKECDIIISYQFITYTKTERK